MLTMKEYLAGLYGAARLALFKPDGIAAFPPSVPLALRSFQTLLVFLPLWVVLNWPQDTENLTAHGISLAVYVVFVCLLYIISLFCQLLVTHLFAVKQGVAGRFPAYVSANNWTSLFSLPLLMSLNTIGNSVILPDSTSAAFFEASVQALLLAYSWFVITMALRLKPRTGLGIVILQFFIFVFTQFIMMHWMAVSLQLHGAVPPAS